MARGKKEKVKLAVLLGLSVSSFQVHTNRLRVRCLSPKPEPEGGSGVGLFPPSQSQRGGGETDGLSEFVKLGIVPRILDTAVLRNVGFSSPVTSLIR